MLTKEQIIHIMAENDLILRLYSNYLNEHPRFLTKEMVKSLSEDCHISDDEAFLTLFSAACGLDTVENPRHKALERDYIRAGLCKVNPTLYRNDEYCKTVRFPSAKCGKWEFKEESFLAYEPFVRRDLILENNFREIPQIGYFDEDFSYPAVLENGVEWMTVTPNEVETMKAPIEESHGNVLTLGLGLGYFAFHASQKESVQSVTVLERDASVISLFEKYLLPQFPNKEKIRIVHADAFDYLETSDLSRFDTVFADLWHDQSDGLPLYIRLRRFEKAHPENVGFSYWIEPELLSSLRKMVFDKLTEKDAKVSFENLPPQTCLSDKYLKNLAGDMR